MVLFVQREEEEDGDTVGRASGERYGIDNIIPIVIIEPNWSKKQTGWPG